MRSLRILLRWPIRSWLHRRCLRRIAALECAMGIGRITMAPKTFWIEDEEISIKPGVVWPVNDASDIVFFPAPTNHVEIISTAFGGES